MIFKKIIIALLFIICAFNVKAEKKLVDTAKPDSAFYLKNPNYQRQIALFDTYKMKQADIVMLGNSITHGANWNQLLGRENVIEQGIPSDVVEGFYNRMEYVFRMKPKVCFIMGGINDIYAWIPNMRIMKFYKKIIEELKERNIKPIIQSTLYAGKDWPNSEDRNKQVTKLNARLKKYARENDIIFIDLNPLMSEGGYLKEDLSFDNLHLNGKGYGIWAKEIEKVLRKLGM